MAIQPIREPLPEPPGFDRHMVWKVPFATAACCPSKVNRESVPVPWFAANSSPQGAMASPTGFESPLPEMIPVGRRVASESIEKREICVGVVVCDQKLTPQGDHHSVRPVEPVTLDGRKLGRAVIARDPVWLDCVASFETQ